MAIIGQTTQGLQKMYLLHHIVSLVFFALSVGLSRAEPQCQRINETISDPYRDVKVHCGYNYTTRFTFSHHFTMYLKHVTVFKRIFSNCSALLDVMACSIYLPRCTEEIKGPYLPCRGVCYEWTHDCKDVIQRGGMEWVAALCDLLPENDNPQTSKGYLGRCFTPPNYRDEGRKFKHSCTDIVIPVCQGIPGYTSTSLSQIQQRVLSSWFTNLIHSNSNESDDCFTLRKEFVCTNFITPCVDGVIGSLCKDKCVKFFNTCKTQLPFGEDVCIEYPSRDDKPAETAVCKFAHWPRAHNWQLPENPLTPTPVRTQNSPATAIMVTQPTVGSVAPSETKAPPDVQARKMSAGAIAGTVLGSLAGLAFIVAAILLFRRYNWTTRRQGPSLMLNQDMDEL